MRPERVVRDLAELLPADSVVVADPGTPCPYFSAYFELTNPAARLISNRAHGALGYSLPGVLGAYFARPSAKRSEEHTSELKSLMRISYAVFCLTKNNNIT